MASLGSRRHWFVSNILQHRVKCMKTSSWSFICATKICWVEDLPMIKIKNIGFCVSFGFFLTRSDWRTSGHQCLLFGKDFFHSPFNSNLKLCTSWQSSLISSFSTTLWPNTKDTGGWQMCHLCFVVNCGKNSITHPSHKWQTYSQFNPLSFTWLLIL